MPLWRILPAAIQTLTKLRENYTRTTLTKSRNWKNGRIISKGLLLFKTLRRIFYKTTLLSAAINTNICNNNWLNIRKLSKNNPGILETKWTFLSSLLWAKSKRRCRNNRIWKRRIRLFRALSAFVEVIK